MKIHHTGVSEKDIEAGLVIDRKIGDSLLHSVLISGGTELDRFDIGDEILSWVPGEGAYGIAVVEGERTPLSSRPDLDSSTLEGTYHEEDTFLPVRWLARRWNGPFTTEDVGTPNIPRNSGSTLSQELEATVRRLFDLV